jgi:hypothetical protein
MPNRFDLLGDSLKVGSAHEQIRTNACTERPYGEIAACEDDALVSFFDTLMSFNTETVSSLDRRVPRRRAVGLR